MKNIIVIVYLSVFFIESFAIKILPPRPSICPIPSKDIKCKPGFHPGQIIDINGCLVWECVPDQPYCCPYTTPDTIKCTKTTVVGQVYDTETGCLIWTCVPRCPPGTFCPPNDCPDIDLNVGFACFVGTPYIGINSRGCEEWMCTSGDPVEIEEGILA